LVLELRVHIQCRVSISLLTWDRLFPGRKGTTVHVLLIYGEGRMEEALLLRSVADRMRVMLRGRADAIEFRRIDGTWMNESGATIEIGAAMPVERPMEVEEESARVAARQRSQFALDRFGQLRAN
jgi:hypothetical protein